MNDRFAKVSLPDVTLVSIDTDPVSQSLTRAAITRTLSIIEPSAIKHFGIESLGVGEEFVMINRFQSIDDYSEFVFKCLWPFCGTERIMIIHWDGHPTNPERWDPKFLDCDYIGAPWAWAQDSFRVGNGGFSIRSKRLIDLCKNVNIRRHPEIPYANAEDVVIGRVYRKIFEEVGLHFANDEVASRFSYETGPVRREVFGFHGPTNLPLFVSEEELLETVGDLFVKLSKRPHFEQFIQYAAMRGYRQLVKFFQDKT